MIYMMSCLWDLCMIFFTSEVIYQPFFMGLILMPTVFYIIYLLIDLIDVASWM